jgi:putative membrane protein
MRWSLDRKAPRKPDMANRYSDSGCIWKSVAAGALGGLAGSFAMNQFQSLVSAASKASKGNGENSGQEESAGQDEDATVKTAKAISQTVFDHELAEDEKKWAGPLVHYSLGTTLGAVYGLVAEQLPVARTGFGTAYGAAVWLGADEIAVPALGLSKGPRETPLASHVNALASHLVYGFVTGLTRKLICRNVA